VLRLAGALLVTVVTRLARLRVTWLAVARLAMLLALTWLLTLAFSFLVLVHFQTSSFLPALNPPVVPGRVERVRNSPCAARAAERPGSALTLVRYCVRY